MRFERGGHPHRILHNFVRLLDCAILYTKYVDDLLLESALHHIRLVLLELLVLSLQLFYFFFHFLDLLRGDTLLIFLSQLLNDSLKCQDFCLRLLLLTFELVDHLVVCLFGCLEFNNNFLKFFKLVLLLFSFALQRIDFFSFF